MGLMAYRRPIKDVPLYVRTRRIHRQKLRLRKAVNETISCIAELMGLCLAVILIVILANLLVGHSPGETMKLYTQNIKVGR